MPNDLKERMQKLEQAGPAKQAGDAKKLERAITEAYDNYRAFVPGLQETAAELLELSAKADEYGFLPLPTYVNERYVNHHDGFVNFGSGVLRGERFSLSVTVGNKPFRSTESTLTQKLFRYDYEDRGVFQDACEESGFTTAADFDTLAATFRRAKDEVRTLREDFCSGLDEAMSGYLEEDDPER